MKENKKQNNKNHFQFSIFNSQFFERLAKAMLTLSGSITSFAILLIVVFLFKEGLGLFNSPNVEKGYVLCVNASNPIERLTPQQIKQIFDEEITVWDFENGGVNAGSNFQFSTFNFQLDIMLFRFDEIFSLYSDEEFGEDYELLPEKLGEVIAENINIIAFLPEKYLPTNNDQVKVLPSANISLSDFFGGTEWIPTATPSAQFGVLPLILGTLWVSIFAILIALPLGLGVAIYLSELAGERIRKILKPTI